MHDVKRPNPEWVSFECFNYVFQMLKKSKLPYNKYTQYETLIRFHAFNRKKYYRFSGLLVYGLLMSYYVRTYTHVSLVL